MIKRGDIYYAEATAIRRRAVPTWGVFIDEEKQGGGTGVYLKDDVAAVPAVTAVGAAVRHILFAVKGNGAVAAVARLDIDLGFIDNSLGITHVAPPRPSGE